MCAAAGTRTAATHGSAGRITPPHALSSARVGHRQRQRVHKRDLSGLLRASRDRVHALPPLSQERPGLGGAEEWRRRAPHDRLSPLRGSGSRRRASTIVCCDAPIREFLPTLVQTGREGASRGAGQKALSPAGYTLPKAIGAPADQRGGATPPERAARQVGPG